MNVLFLSDQIKDVAGRKITFADLFLSYVDLNFSNQFLTEIKTLPYFLYLLQNGWISQH